MNKFFGISLLLVLFQGLQLAAQEKKTIDQIIAVVGNHIIMESDIETQRLQMQAQGYYSQGDPKCEILEQMIFQKLLLHQAALDSIEVKDEDVDSELERKLNYFINQIGSEEKLEEYYHKSIPEIKSDFRDLIRDQMITQRMHGKITGEIKVTPTEVRTFFNDIPKDSIPLVPAEYEIQQIVKYPVIEESEILAVKEKLREMRERVVKGENFATLAILYSEDPGSAKNGGELGFVGRGDLVTEFAAVAFNLKPGEVSKIFKTDYGFHIVQMIERKGERINVRHILATPKVNPKKIAEARLSLDSIARRIKTDTLTFDLAAFHYSQDKDTRLNNGMLVNPYTGNSRFEASQIESGIAQAISTLKVGEISNPFESKDDLGHTVVKIVSLKTKTETHKANLKDDYQKIQEMALDFKKEDFLKKWVAKKRKGTYMKIDEAYKCPEKN